MGGLKEVGFVLLGEGGDGVAIALPDMGGLKESSCGLESKEPDVAIALPDMGGLKESRSPDLYAEAKVAIALPDMGGLKELLLTQQRLRA